MASTVAGTVLFFEYAIKKGSGSQGFIDMFWPGKLLTEQKSGGRALSKAHKQLDRAPDKLCQKEPFACDPARPDLSELYTIFLNIPTRLLRN